MITRRLPHLIRILAALVILTPAFATDTPGPLAVVARPSLVKSLESFLPRWDANRNGKLDRTEVENLLRDPAIRQVEAATLACAHFYFLKNPSRTSATIGDLSSTVKETAVFTRGTVSFTFKMEKEFEFFLNHLATTPRELFGTEAPTLKGISQGHLGNCFFVSMIGAMAHCNPEAIRAMITQNPDKSISVKFPDGRSTRIPRIPDTLIALGSRTGPQGVWLNVLEEAYGEVYKSKAAQDPAVFGIDRLSRGGNIGETIELLTGNKSETTTWKPGVPEDLLMVRYLLAKGRNQKALMGAGVPLDLKKPPPAIVVAHAYAILDFDEKTDRITLWNPHGNDFSPKGEDGFLNGYTTRHGIFTISTRDFSFLFGSLFVEDKASRKGSKPR